MGMTWFTSIIYNALIPVLILAELRQEPVLAELRSLPSCYTTSRNTSHHIEKFLRCAAAMYTLISPRRMTT